jgi:hypothetical protein
MVVSLLISATLLLSLQSVLMIATRAIPSGNSRASSLIAGSNALSTISSDVFYATSVTEMTPTVITLTVPDRIGGGQPHTVRYAWSGNAGDPLTRQFNGGNVVAIVPSIQSFSLFYDKRAVQAPTTYTTSAETLLADDTSTSNPTDFRVASNAWPGQYFAPSLPSNANTWAVTRVLLPAEVSGVNIGQSLVQIRAVDANGYPTSTVLDQQTLLENNLTTSYAWQQFNFSNATGLSPSQAAAIVVQWVSDTYSCNIQYQGAGLLGLGGLIGGLLGTGNMVQWNGNSWSTVSGCNLYFYVYGTYTTPNPPTNNYYLKDVRCSLQTLSDASTLLTTMIRVPGEPQVSGP